MPWSASGKGEEELLQLLLSEWGIVTALQALAHPGRDDLEAGAVKGLGDRGQLRDDIGAGPTVLDHRDDAVDLPACALEASDDLAGDLRIDFHTAMVAPIPFGV